MSCSSAPPGDDDDDDEDEGKERLERRARVRTSTKSPPAPLLLLLLLLLAIFEPDNQAAGVAIAAVVAMHIVVGRRSAGGENTWSAAALETTTRGSTERLPLATAAAAVLADIDFDFRQAAAVNCNALRLLVAGTETPKSLLPLSLLPLVVEGGVEKGRLKASMGVVAFARPPP